jgi:hypothetical protein
MAATTPYPQDHSYPPLPFASHDMDRSETNFSTSSIAKNRYLIDDDNDSEAHPFPKEGAPQWDQPPPPPEPQQPARKWWQGVRIHTSYLSSSSSPVPPSAES